MASVEFSKLFEAFDLKSKGLDLKKISEQLDKPIDTITHRIKNYEKYLNNPDFDLRNTTHNNFILLEPLSIKNGNVTKWKVKCKFCNSVKEVRSSKLFGSQNIKPKTYCSLECCGHQHKKFQIGDRIGQLTLLEYTRVNGQSNYKCKCDCGNVILKHNWNRNIKSCGCLATNERSKITDKEKISAYVHRQYKQYARRRNLEFNLTRKDVHNLIFKLCHYCRSIPAAPRSLNVWKSDRAISNRTIRRNIEIKTQGIDRIDNTKGYSKENCVPCCNMCNCAKLDYTLQEFKDWVKSFKPLIKHKPKNRNIHNGLKESMKIDDGQTLAGWYYYYDKEFLLSGLFDKALDRRSVRKGSAKTRNIDYNLTLFEDVKLQLFPCAYCNEKNDLVGIDRLDNSKGYDINNVLSCCYKCNTAKGDKNIKEFVKWRRKIKKHIDKITS